MKTAFVVVSSMVSSPCVTLSFDCTRSARLFSDLNTTRRNSSPRPSLNAVKKISPKTTAVMPASSMFGCQSHIRKDTSIVMSVGSISHDSTFSAFAFETATRPVWPLTTASTGPIFST